MERFKIKFFNSLDSKYPKDYIDYLIKNIKTNKDLPNEELKLIRNTKIKYYSLVLFNIPFFLFRIKRFYNYNKMYNLKKQQSINFVLTTLIPMLMMVVLADKIYYRDLKYLIIKYSSITLDNYENTKLNRLIIENYDNNAI